MNVVITGASGMVGMGVLLECLDSPEVSSVLVVNRTTIAMNHPKLKEVLAVDFSQLTPIQEDLKGYQACFFCAGISAFGQSEASYHKMTYDLTVHFAKTFLAQNRNSVFCYVSGAGTDGLGKSTMMWARVKGKTENALSAMPFRASYMFRPGYIQPMRGIQSKTKWYALVYVLFRPIYSVLKHFPNAATTTSNVGKAMIRVGEGNHTTAILNNKAINQLAEAVGQKTDGQ